MLCTDALSVRAGRSLTSAIRDAFERDEAGFESPSTSPAPSTPSSPLTPLSDANSMDVPITWLPHPSPTNSSHSPTAVRADSPPADALNPPAASDAESEGCDPPSDTDCLSMSDGASSDCSSEYTGGGLDSARAPPTKGKRKRSESDKRAKKTKRQRRRQANAEEREPTSLREPTFHRAPSTLHTDLTSEEAMSACSTGFTALRASSLKPGKVWSLPQALAAGHKLLAWDGR